MLEPGPLQPDRSFPAPEKQRDIWTDLGRPAVPHNRQNTLSPEKREKLLASIDAKDFNVGQRALVQHVDGPLLGLAGAGSGKTHALTHRIARLVGCGVRPARILAVTFTKKAADEMKDRSRKLLRGYSHGLPTIRTLHSLGFKILRENAELINYKNGVRIMTEIYADQFLMRGLNELTPTLRNALEGKPIVALGDMISGWKNSGFSPYHVRDKLKDPYAPAYITYQSWLQQTGFVDFDDLIRLPTALFTHAKGGREVLEHWQKKFDYIMVDEYQDTNTAQEDLLCLLAQRTRNICVVGDDDQSIYGWRGANVENIRGFEKRWAGSKIAKLEINYRSTPNILEAANNLIAASTEERHQKTLQAHKAAGIDPLIKVCSDEYDEALWIAETIKKSIASGRGPGDFAILVRDQYNSKASRLEEALATAEIPYEVWFTEDLKMGPTKRNAYSLLSAIHDPLHEEPAFLQLLSSSSLSIDSDDYNAMLKLRQEGAQPLWKIMCSEELPSLSKKGLRVIHNLHNLVHSLHTRARQKGRNEHLSEIAYRGFRRLFPAATDPALWDDPKTGNEDTIALRTICKNVAAYEKSAKARNKTFASYLQFQLVEIPRRIREGQTKRKANEERSKVTLMTMHGSKGLEFPVVFLPAFVEGVIPHEKACLAEDLTPKKKQRQLIDTHDAPVNSIEEERRLLYVGMTRAQEELLISYPETFSFRGKAMPQKISRFGEETGIRFTAP